MKKYILTIMAAAFILTSGTVSALAASTIPGIGIGTVIPTDHTQKTVPALLPEPDESVIIADGIYCGSLGLGGMHPSEARKALTDYFEGIKQSHFIVKAESLEFMCGFSSIGFEYDVSGTVSKAAFVGQYGLLINRYKQTTDLRRDKLNLDIPYSVNEGMLEQFVNTNIASHDSPAQDAQIARSNGEFVITPSVTGLVTDVPGTIAAIKDAIRTSISQNMVVDAVAVVSEPKIKTADLECIHDKLGTYSTYYGDSPEGRKNNLKVGSGNINGTIVMPGESFSTSETMKQRTPENGYQIATEYLSGESVEAYGGGVCQVASTLYNAALHAELQIDKRYNHSMLVSYVEPSFDAAISWGFKDFVFTNNTGSPIYIAASANGETLTFTIYGKEYRDPGHKVEYTNVIVKRIVSETLTVEDPTAPLGVEVSRKGSNHDECVSYLVKNVYENGVLTETVKFKKDEYQASHKVITIGSGASVDPTSAEDPGDPTSADEPVQQ